METSKLVNDEKTQNGENFEGDKGQGPKPINISESNKGDEIVTNDSSNNGQEKDISGLSEEIKADKNQNNEFNSLDFEVPDEPSTDEEFEVITIPYEFDPKNINAPEYEDGLTPSHDLYLAKTTEIPEHIKEPKYLITNLFEKVIVTSYSRSGNTLVRKYIQDITGIITGSDTDLRGRLCQYLISKGLKGEGKINNRVWCIKSHYPLRETVNMYNANKCVLIVRNPMDTVISLFNMVATRTHTLSMIDEDFEKFNSLFDVFLEQEVTVWRDFQKYWMDNPIIPTYVVRYEDMMSDPKTTLLDLFRFLLNEKDLEGTLIEALIEHHTKSKTIKQVYKPRKGKVNGNRDLYKDHQIKQIKKLAGQVLKRLGYVYEDSDTNSNTAFYSDDEDVESSSQYDSDPIIKNGKEAEVTARHTYDELNQIALDEVCCDEYRNSVKELSSLKSMEIGNISDALLYFLKTV